MKRLIVCCDGTWNNPDQEDNGIPAPTNVFKLHNAMLEGDADGVQQLKYYHPGVGGEGGAKDKILGGALGVGVSRHICSAYHWLASHYEEGDHIFLFGFSRGAFTARSIGGFLWQGLLDLNGLAPGEAWERVHTAYQRGYRKPNATSTDWAASDWAFFNDRRPVPVRFIGVWDTVGALGIPDDLELLNLFDNKKKWQFHNTALGDHIQTARHAMAIDEVRSSFSIARWSNAADHGDVKEVWFPGAHSDVGGGYADCELANGALLWMMDESHEAAGLAFREGVRDTIQADPLGVLHNSYKGAFAKLRSRPRNIDAMVPANAGRFHESVFIRQKESPIAHAPYHPTRVLAVDDPPVTVDVFASERWNPTGLYLERGHTYRFSATGEWQDSADTCDWTGTEDNKLTLGDAIRASSSFLGVFEDLFKNVTDNKSTDFMGTKRVEDLKWFVLVGAIANDAGTRRAVRNDGSPVPHQYVALPEYKDRNLVIQHPGYLYCFANDVWSLYGNNRGSVQLTIRRTS